jgi:hypothetical protein
VHDNTKRPAQDKEAQDAGRGPNAAGWFISTVEKTMRGGWVLTGWTYMVRRSQNEQERRGKEADMLYLTRAPVLLFS